MKSTEGSRRFGPHRDVLPVLRAAAPHTIGAFNDVLLIAGPVLVQAPRPYAAVSRPEGNRPLARYPAYWQ